MEIKQEAATQSTRLLVLENWETMIGWMLDISGGQALVKITWSLPLHLDRESWGTSLFKIPFKEMSISV